MAKRLAPRFLKSKTDSNSRTSTMKTLCYFLLVTNLLLLSVLPASSQSVSLSGQEKSWAKGFVEKTVIPQLNNGKNFRGSYYKDFDIKGYRYYEKGDGFQRAMRDYMNDLIREKSDFVVINSYFYSNRNSNVVKAQISSMHEGWSFRFLPKNTEIAQGITIGEATQTGLALIVQEPTSWAGRTYATVWRNVVWTGEVVDGYIDGEGAGCYYIYSDDNGYVDNWLNGTFYFNGSFEKGKPKHVNITQTAGKNGMDVRTFAVETDGGGTMLGMTINGRLGLLVDNQFVDHYQWQTPTITTGSSWNAGIWKSFLRKESRLKKVSDSGIATIERRTVFKNDIQFTYRVTDSGEIVGLIDEEITTEQIERQIDKYYHWLLDKYAKVAEGKAFTQQGDLDNGKYYNLLYVYQQLISNKLIHSPHLDPKLISTIFDLRQVMLNDSYAKDRMKSPYSYKQAFVDLAKSRRYNDCENTVSHHYNYLREEHLRPFNSLMESPFFPRNEYPEQTKFVTNNVDVYLSYLKQQYEAALPEVRERDQALASYYTQQAAEKKERASRMVISSRSTSPSGELMYDFWGADRHYLNDGVICFDSVDDCHVSYNIYPDRSFPYKISYSGGLDINKYEFKTYDEMINEISTAYYKKYGK